MIDLDERLRHDLDALAGHIEPTRSADEVIAGLGQAALPLAPSRRRWLIPAIAAAVVFAVVIGIVAVLAARHDEATDVYVGPPPTTGVTAWDPSALGPGWHDLPAGPLGALSPRAMVWTGQELIVWRGESTDPAAETGRAATYDPSSGSWTELPIDPLGAINVAGTGTGGAWTGTETVFWTADADPVVAWNPDTGAWRESAPPPHGHEKNAVWTGDELIFWADGLAYNPTTDSWRTIASPSDFLVAAVNDYDSAGLVWTGDQVVVVGALSGAYDPRTDRWREFGQVLAEDPARPGTQWDSFTATAAYWDGAVVAFDGSPTSGAVGSTTAAVLDLGSGTWSAVTGVAPPLPSTEGSPVVVPLDDGRVVVWHGGRLFLRGLDGSWSAQPPGPAFSLLGTGSAVFSYGGRDIGPFFAVYVPPDQAGPTATPQGYDPAVLGPGWHDLGPAQPTGSRVQIWTGSELFLYGSTDADEKLVDEGAAFDPATGRWRRTGPSGLTDITGIGGGWTSDRGVVWSRDGVRLWDPTTGIWQAAADPPAPLTVQWGGDAAIVGGKIWFWKDGLSYDPATDTWTAISPPPAVPTRTSAATDGTTLYVSGLLSEQIPSLSVSLAYDTSTDSWRELPASGLDGQALDTVWFGGRLVGVDYQSRAAAYDPAADSWQPLAPIPLQFGEDWPLVSLAGDDVLLNAQAGSALLGPDGTWTVLDRLFPAWGRPVSAGNAAFVVADDIWVYVPG